MFPLLNRVSKVETWNNMSLLRHVAKRDMLLLSKETCCFMFPLLKQFHVSTFETCCKTRFHTHTHTNTHTPHTHTHTLDQVSTVEPSIQFHWCCIQIFEGCIFRKRALWFMALLREETCKLRHLMYDGNIHSIPLMLPSNPLCCIQINRVPAQCPTVRCHTMPQVVGLFPQKCH